MKKINYLFTLICVAVVFSSCKWGSYIPHSLTMGGTSTNVVLTQANYRVVRNVEAVVEINNSNLRRADVEKSAFAELTRKYPLTGSQAYINVVTEEIRRENSNFFRYWFGGKPNIKQYVAVRATIIEFLQENGEPVKSVESPYNTASQQAVQSEVKKVDTPKSKPEDMPSLAKLSENKFYMALLLKTGKFNSSMQKEAEKYFDFKELNKLRSQNSLSDLQNKSSDHDKRFEKFAK